MEWLFLETVARHENCQCSRCFSSRYFNTAYKLYESVLRNVAVKLSSRWLLINFHMIVPPSGLMHRPEYRPSWLRILVAFLRANDGILHQLGNDCFLPHVLQWIIHQSSCKRTKGQIWNTQGIGKYTNKPQEFLNCLKAMYTKRETFIG
jgi:hypothetical protein